MFSLPLPPPVQRSISTANKLGRKVGPEPRAFSIAASIWNAAEHCSLHQLEDIQPSNPQTVCTPSLSRIAPAGYRQLPSDEKAITCLAPTEVSTLYLLVPAQSITFILKDNAAGLEHVSIIGNFEGEVCILFHQQNGDP